MAETLAWIAFLFAAFATTGWFIGRGLALWVLPFLQHAVPSKKEGGMPLPHSDLGVISNATRR